MFRYFIPLSAVLFLLVASAHAGEKSPYAATAAATRTGDRIVVSIKIETTAKQDVPGMGLTDVTTTLACPKIILLQGQRAQIAVGSASPAFEHAKDQQPNSGYSVDIVSVKDRDELVMLTVVMDKGQITWAEATVVPIEVSKRGEAK